MARWKRRGTIRWGQEDVGAESGGPLTRVDVVLVRYHRVRGVKIKDLDAVLLVERVYGVCRLRCLSCSIGWDSSCG